MNSDMMPEQGDILAFVIATIILSCLAALLLPRFFRRLTIRQAVPVLALIGPLLAVAGSLFGGLAMTLSSGDVGYVVMVGAITGVAAVIVGWRLARPLARDIDALSVTIDAIAGGDRTARSGVFRPDEVGALATTVDELARRLARSEAERGAAEDERRAVVSALSHDLRTPLASLLASVDALEDGLGDQPQHLAAMRRNVLALERLVEDLFLLARADSGSLALHPEPLDLAELIDEAVEAVGPAALEAGVRLVAVLSVAIPIEGDDVALGRVLRNLLDNAVRHSAGRVEISASVAGAAPLSVTTGSVATGRVATRNAEPVRAGQVVVTIRDDGPGFDAKFVPHAFERFTQADGARSRLGGAGLGLAIAQTLVEAHEGSIAIVPGPGGCVEVRLPSAGKSPAISDLESV